MYKFIALILIVVIGILLSMTGILDPHKLLVWARHYDDQWWLVAILVAVQVLLFTFALAGSVVLWIAAVLYEPIAASLILAAGATLGGLSAYFFSATLSEEWVRRVENSHIYRLLRKQDNFFALLSMRVMPGFPQGLFNYSSGILRVNLLSYVVASFIGIGLKSYIYAPIIYKAAGGASVKDLFDISTIGPLILISLALFSVVMFRYKWNQKHGIPTE